MAPLSPELRLMTACAMWPPSDRRTEAIRAAVARPLDWSRVLRIGRRHHVVGLAHDGLRRVATDLPLEFSGTMATEAALMVRQNLATAHEALRLQRLFDDAGLPVLFIKGVALAILAFGDLGLRGAQDIDILVAPETLADATALILGAGYRRFDPAPDISDAQLRLLIPLRKDLGFVHQATGMRVELHWRLFLNRHAMADASIMASSRVVPVAGTAGLRTLGEEDLFAYLCMHGAIHWWNRLKWLADVNAILACVSQDGVERLFGAAQARGVGRAAAQAVLLCRRLLGTSLSIKSLDKSTTLRWLEATALSAMTTGQGEHDPHEVRFGTTRGSLSTVLLSRSRRYQLAELRIQLTSPTDVLTLPLPQPLRFLYPVLRLPLWAWRHTVHHNVRRQQAGSTPNSIK
jgi:hypothetical protein